METPDRLTLKLTLDKPNPDFLLGLVANESDAIARMAVAALALHRYDERLKERTAQAVDQSGRAALKAFFEERFGAK